MEIVRTFSRIKQVIAEKRADARRGHTLEEEIRVHRILNNPTGISADDIEKYKSSRLNYVSSLMTMSINILGTPALQNANSLWKEMERQKRLTPEQLAAETLEDARQKNLEWQSKQTA